VRVLAMLLTAAAVASAAAWPLFDMGPVPLVVVIALELVLNRVLRDRVQAVTAAIQGPREELNVLATVFARVERETFAHRRTVALRAELGAGGIAAAAQIRRLERLVTWLDAQRNQFFIPIAIVTNWSVHFAFAIETWRRRCGPLIGRWLSALAELEALNALSTFAFDNPDDPFPEVLALGNGAGPRYQGDDLGHPLLPRDRAVRNSVDLGTVTQVLVVSGSNMSGKSTLLRTVGINAVLALAGAPVRATRLSMTPLQIGATLRVLDSLSEGTSRFYAEIRRLRQLMELTREAPPLLFLLDEILHGTNSHDRQIGAEAVVEGLLDAGAIGLVTTHDLALARTADALAPRGKNIHFEDELLDGRLHFDYRLRDGVVTKSNALDLMRSIGLPV
jgi:hypothetical protein